MRTSRTLAAVLLTLLCASASWSLPSKETRVWIEGAQILAKAKSCLSQSGLSADLMVVVEPAGTFVADGSLAWETRLLPSRDRLQRVRVQLMSKDRPLQSWTVFFREPSTRVCLFAARDLRAGTLLTEADVVMASEPLGQHPNLCSDIDEALGRTLVANLSTGKPVPQRSLVLRPVFRRGDKVAVSLKDGGISVELSGVALGSGYPGREFRMKSASGKVMTVYVDMEGRPFLPEGRGL